ncbi:hypothetical protein RB598_001642 [Gaeumannomyces tritici]
MAEPSCAAPALVPLQNGSLHSRRQRPPDLDLAREHDNRVPLRAESARMRRRESRLGLINIFGRQKSSVDLASSTAAASSTASLATTATSPPLTTSSSSSSRDLSLPRSAGIRASLAEMSHWSRADSSNHHRQHHQEKQQQRQQRQQTPPSDPSGSPGSTTPAPTPRSAKAPAGAKTKGSSIPAPKPGRGSLATWDPPPLFQAYPQAIRQIELPACTVSAETILRLNGGRASQAPAAMPDAEALSDLASDKAKRKHRRNTSSMASFRSDWTTKIYVLVTSGYLLQYAGEGSFDRLPEKILHLSKDSAAFASDLIPGRHWVVQVSAAMEADGTSTADSRSLLSRLPFRGAEKRNASAFLMVFESADDMDQWIATLRREIEHLGGKKKLSETGKPKADDNVLQLRGQPSQRTLVVRDPERFSRVIAPEQLTWVHEAPAMISTTPATPATPSTLDVLLGSPEMNGAHDRSFDDLSTTNSFASQDGQQLDFLRDESHRLSYVSSGQRTVMTSEGSSSPSCSPTRDSFSSHLDDRPCNPHSEKLVPDAQLRPNVKVILDRRMSMRSPGPLSSIRPVSSAPRTVSDCQPDATHLNDSWPLTTPNFSVPHSVSKRFSIRRSPGPSDEAPPPPPKSTLAPPPRPFPRRPPPSLGAFSRPLSVVADQPSPMSPRFHYQGLESRLDEAGRVHNLKSPLSPGVAEGRRQQAAETRIAPAVPAKTSLSSRRASMQPLAYADSPRRSISTLGLRKRASDFALRQRAVAAPEPRKWQALQHVALATKTPDQPANRLADGLADRPRLRASRVVSGTDMWAQPRTSQRLGVSRPVSVVRQHEPNTHPRFSQDVDVDWRTAPHPPPKDSPPLKPTSSPREPRSEQAVVAVPRTSTSTQYLRTASDTKALLNRHSVPQLADVPPPLPPPTCALPPIPLAHRGPAVRQTRAHTIKT